MSNQNEPPDEERARADRIAKLDPCRGKAANRPAPDEEEERIVREAVEVALRGTFGDSGEDTAETRGLWAVARHASAIGSRHALRAQKSIDAKVIDGLKAKLSCPICKDGPDCSPSYVCEGCWHDREGEHEAEVDTLKALLRCARQYIPSARVNLGMQIDAALGGKARKEE